MCRRKACLAQALIGLGLGLLLSFLLGGWFLRVLTAAALLVIGILLLDR